MLCALHTCIYYIKLIKLYGTTPIVKQPCSICWVIWAYILYAEIGKPSFVCKNIYPEGRNIEYTMLHTCKLIRKKEQNITKYMVECYP